MPTDRDSAVPPAVLVVTRIVPAKLVDAFQQ